MKTQLQRIRKDRGFKSAKAFAEHIGMSKDTYTNYEQGARPITLELAWEFADVLGCTLDELAGRDFKADSYADPRQAVMNDDYARLSDAGKDAAAGAVRGIRASEGARVGAAGLEDHQIAASA
ncbi:helix-turn-helix domain-containing protein [Adlercreutzia equolifaciens]|uniref:Helix-turn-helix domain-containing protein n=2 Tax=Adlercreutzia TaxID=447020 RepID=A0A6N8JLS1_9ACTN|nr:MULTISPECIES: helix-turn-helix transcriptional regulator [Adlercreutzia]MCB6760096.1 helix-turn-helix domain-containing protein [Adlercreutzia equolifaciens]MCB6975685.1 helix-turn-helix domain-containing protein [Adlercreutzia equolifaciens]MCQ5070835.1 helix-turn-helix domain-containing protein [Adlercreutzia sp. DFI.6.23]MDE8683829.1 helix-turn-helix transcriptional regulator [Adlercreutzia rubneri]MVX60841.1 helix-turn-helix domain-containing protein [Adlercreutzia mucosicola]